MHIRIWSLRAVDIFHMNCLNNQERFGPLEELRETLGIIDYAHLFISDKNDRKLADHQNKTLCNLGLEVSHVSHDPYKRIFNHSSFNLPESEKSLLCKGLNFAIPLDKLEYSDHL